MHERSVANALVQQAAEIVIRSGADRAVSVGIRLGGASSLSEPHLRSQFAAAADGTVLEDALLEVIIVDDESDTSASEGVVLTHVEVADPGKEPDPVY